MDFIRSSGTLVHPTSFPSDYAIGDLGKKAYEFIDYLEETHQGVWQILPLGPTGFGNSPYASYSAFAGNPYLLSPDILKDKGLLKEKELADRRVQQSTSVDYDRAYAIKDELFSLACRRFYDRKDAEEQKRFKAFKKDNAVWLDDYVLFMSCLIENDKRPWNQWDEGLARRDKKALDSARKKLKKRIDSQYWVQFEFFEQWMALRKYANNKQIKIIGDIPIFVDHNSSDVWANKKYFDVDETGNRLLVSGVPPDYFSETGQLWGNPLYRWKELEKDGYKWWIERFRQMFTMFDAIRVDHFRGFDAYWEIKADAKTAMNGRWVKGPGEKLFVAIEKKLGKLPIIAEDLGVITPNVVKLRDRFDFPGMKVLQFAFDDPGNGFLPHNYKNANCIVYSGTHDNDTTLGWYQQAPEGEQNYLREYTQSDGSDVSWQLIRLGMLSVANQAIFPLQDFMELDGEHRMNFPGTTEDNWMWRYTDAMLDALDSDRIRHVIGISNRNPRDARSDSNMSDIDAENP
ncbi:MAG: 4-alpha-glucanotransferase [Cyclonatronaceae bacterium]